MIKILALNELENTNNEDEFANILTKEAQEQVALNEYNRALVLLISNKKEEALNVFQELLNTELLDQIQKPPIYDGRSRPMVSLKYSCFKNIANIQTALKDYNAAIINYCEASYLDDSDVNLWYKIGITAIETYNLELACMAFKQGLRKNCNHWPCLDNIITVLYAIPDYMNCLLYISLALERDATYIKGLLYRQEIFNTIPCFKDCYKDYNKFWIFDPPHINSTKAADELLINEASKLKKQWTMKSNKKIMPNNSPILFLKKLLIKYSWLELGKHLIELYEHINDNNFSFLNPISFSNFYSVNTFNTQTLKKDVYSFSNGKDLSFELATEQNSNSIYKVTDIDKGTTINSNAVIEEISDKMISNKFHLKNINMFSSICKEDKEAKSENFKYCMDENISDTSKMKTYDLNPKIDSKFNEVDQPNKSGDKDKNQKGKKRRRSSLCFLTQWAWSNNIAKRPSRARNSTRKDYDRDGVALEEILKLFPSDLLSDSTEFIKEEASKHNQDLQDTMDLHYFIANKDNVIDDTKSIENFQPSSASYEEQYKYFGTPQEALDIEDFLHAHNNQSNIMIILTKFINCLCSKWKYEWPNELSEFYIQLYLYMRRHIPHSSPFVKAASNISSNFDAQSTLLFCELYIDRWLSIRPCVLLESSLYRLGIGILSDELGYIMFYNTLDELNQEENTTFLLRLLWLKANILLYQGEIEISMKTLELIHYHVQNLSFKFGKPFIKLINCKYNSIISVKTVQRMLASIQRSKRFCQIKYFYQEKQYKELSSILKESFHISEQTSEFFLSKDMLVDRAEHLEMLLNSLWQLQQYEDCYVWAEVCLHESWHNYLHITNSYTNDDEKRKWIRSVLYTLEKLYGCINEASTFVVKYLSNFRLSRLVQNLVHIVCHQLDVLDNTPIMSIETVLPWIILNTILQYEEDKKNAKSVSKGIKNYIGGYFPKSISDEDDDIPASIMILLKAHEYLGRQGWCCINEGKLLIFILKLIIPKLYFPPYSLIKQKLKEPLEQIIYCLYGHPTRLNSGIKTKPKYLEEHVKYHISLSWEMCKLLFDFYKPEKVPTFESKRIDSINSDTATLFKRMCAFIPPENDPAQVTDSMNLYLSGNNEEMPNIKAPVYHNISHIYYLLADYYFKTGSNQSWSIAIKYYMLDLCLHPNELNSWAGLAMSTSTLMETWLNNFQPNINEEKYLTKSKIAQRSYQHAIELAPSHLTIWTEYGNFLYTVHSFCSRLLKQESESLNMERFRILENRKEEMLDKAKNCFISAIHIYSSSQGIDEIQDERWLYQYMLAKISEKKNEEPQLFLKHYAMASEFLFKSHAEYPKRISHKNPQHLALEALEVFYRVHASILKYLEYHEGKPIKKSLAVTFRHSLMYCRPMISTATGSLRRNKLSEDDCHVDSNVQLQKRFSSSSDKNIYHSSSFRMNDLNSIIQTDSRKRCLNAAVKDEVDISKQGGVSHLQLMHDVVSLIDEMITNVCSRVFYDQGQMNNVNNQIETERPYNSKFICNEVLKKNTKDHKSISDHSLQVQLLVENNQFVEFKNNRETSTWIQKEDIAMESCDKLDKLEEKKGYETMKESVTRRNSHESTATTHTSTTETNISSSTSSTNSSTSDDTSESSISSDSDSESIDSDVETKKKLSRNEDSYLSEKETNELIESCISGLEECVLRFPEHYKAIYRLAYFFCYSKTAKSIDKCKKLLLGTYQCQLHSGESIQGLFSDRKNANFFNGIWRIPIHEIDRPGSFASHMSRCILLLMQVLKEADDSRMLTELCIQLRKIPDTDKKYLRDAEREQLSYQALTLCLQCLRNRIKSLGAQVITANNYNNSINEKMQIMMDIYYTFQSIKNIQEYEATEVPKVQKLLETVYTLYIGNAQLQGSIFDLAKDFCRQQLRTKKIVPAEYDSNICTSNVESTEFSRILEAGPPSSAKPPTNTQITKSQKVSINGRSRGRPPGNNTIVNNFKLSQECINRYQLNSIVEPNMLAAMFAPALDPSLINSSVNYFSNIGVYEEMFYQFQSNTNISKYNKKDSTHVWNNQVISNPDNTSRNFCIMKERPDLSIRPITVNPLEKNKKDRKNKNTDDLGQNYSTSILKSANTQNYSESDFSLIQSSTKHYSTTNSDMSPINSLETTITNQPIIPQANKVILTIATSNISEPSKQASFLQQKLLSKKQNQYDDQRFTTLNSEKKYKPNRIFSANTSYNPLNNKSSYTSSVSTKKISPLMTSKEECILKRNIERNIKNVSSATPMSVLTQLQHHSHLEIIPQICTKSSKDVSTMSDITFAQCVCDPVEVLNAENFSVSNLSKHTTSTNVSSTQQKEKLTKVQSNDVEIITLDD